MKERIELENTLLEKCNAYANSCEKALRSKPDFNALIAMRILLRTGIDLMQELVKAFEEANKTIEQLKDKIQDNTDEHYFSDGRGTENDS